MKKAAASVVTTTVTEYLADQPPASRRVLRVVRKAIKAALPAPRSASRIASPPTS